MIIELEISEEGNIYRIKTEWVKFYNKDFYKKGMTPKERACNNWEYKW